jgi:hypothetical protein
MKPRGTSRRYIAARAGGLRFSVCGLPRTALPLPAPAPTLAGFAWFSSAALLAVVFLSVYAAAFPPAFPGDARRQQPLGSPIARYDFSDFASAAR